MQLEKNRADALCRDEESQHKVEQIGAQLQKLTAQFNQFHLASEEIVGEVRKQVSERFERRLEMQSNRIDAMNESGKKSLTSLKFGVSCWKGPSLEPEVMPQYHVSPLIVTG